jgi:transcriptional regulator with XRE-family HTH domain
MAITTDLDLREGIGRRIADIRSFRRLTQEQLAQRIGVNVTAIAHLECGKHFPRFKTLFALSRELGVPLRDLLDEEPVIDEGNDRRAGVELLGRTLLHDLSDQFLTTAVEQLSALAKQDRLSGRDRVHQHNAA